MTNTREQVTRHQSLVSALTSVFLSASSLSLQQQLLGSSGSPP